jgi:KaiC/GvpD/RAD55 family RecA-like ATPase
MTRKSIKMDSERNLVVNLITSTEFCRQIVPILNKNHLKTRYARVVSEWVTDYFKAYDVSPGTLIQDMYREKKISLDEEEAESISEFLHSLSEEYETSDDFNIKYEADKAESYIKLRSLEYLKDQLEYAITEGDAPKGESCVANYTQVGRPESSAVSIVNNKIEIINSFLEEEEYMFKWPKAIGKVAPSPQRGDLIAFLGAAKSGKTWALDFAAGLAMEAGHKVVFFSLEMRKSQLIRRAYQRMTSSPRHDCEILYPFFKPCFDPDSIKDGEEKKWEIYTRKEQRAGVDLKSIEQFQEERKLLYRGGDCHYVALPAYSATVEDLIAQLDNMKYYEGYDPSVMVVDYADILRASKEASKEYRHQIDDIWKKLRALAQARNILIITASQANKSSITNEVTAETVTEDVRKLAHVSIMLAINRKREDKMRSVVRIRSLMQREEQESFDEAIVLQNLQIGRFHLDSKTSSEVDYEVEEEPKHRGK